MADKEQRIMEELQKCRENIQRTKELIGYHRDILKKQEKKADELAARLDKVKMNSLFHLIHEGGYDIDSLRQAVSAGQLTVNPEKPQPETPAKTDQIAAVAATSRKEDV